MEGWIGIVVIGVLLFFWGYGDSVAASNKIVEQIASAALVVRALQKASHAAPLARVLHEALWR